MKTILSGELKEKTGATYRQIDYWCATGVISPIGTSFPGSGYNRKFDISIVPKVSLLAKISEVFGHKVSREILEKVYMEYDFGKSYLGEGIYLEWEVDQE